MASDIPHSFQNRALSAVVSPRPALAHPTGQPGEHSPEGDVHVLDPEAQV